MATNKGPTPNFTLKYAHSRIDYNVGTPGIFMESRARGTACIMFMLNFHPIQGRVVRTMKRENIYQT